MNSIKNSVPVAWLEAIIQRSRGAIIIIDSDRIIRYANDAAARVATVATPELLIGRPYLEILSQHTVLNEEARELPHEEFPSERAFRDGVSTEGYVIAQIAPDGSHHWLSISTFPIAASDRSVQAVAIIYEDVTTERVHENRMRFMIESSKLLSIEDDLRQRLMGKAQLLVPSLADWATINLVEDGDLSRVTVVHRDPNKVALVEEFASYAATTDAEEPAIYRVAQSGVSEIFLTLKPPLLDLIRGSREAESIERLWRELKPCSSIIVPIVNRHKVVGVLSLAYSDSLRHYDESDMHFMQEFGYHLGVTIDNARLYQEIEERNRAKTKFLAMLSHELRNPLAPIKHGLELLRLKYADRGAGDELTMIEHQFDHLSKLLNQLLEITRYTQSKITLEKKDVELRTLVEAAVASRSAFIKDKKIELAMQLPAKPIWTCADPLRLEQAIINIVNNAEKFTPEGGKITVSLCAKSGSAQIQVVDTGIGMDRHYVKKIFDPAHIGDRIKHSEHGGLGMGLVLVSEIARLHDGTIEAQSAGIGTGSTFTLTLPIEQGKSPQETATAPEEQPSPPLDPKLMVLVIDDNAAAADALSRLLNAQGTRAESAHSGRAGIDVFRNKRPQTVIVDIGMDDMDGYAVIRELREHFGPSFLAIALSGYGMPEDKRKTREAGFNYHLTKPIGFAELRLLLQEPRSFDSNLLST